MSGYTNVHRLMARQYGLVHRDQARAGGMSIRTLERYVARGDFERVQPCVYRGVGYDVTVEQRLLAAVLAAGEGAAVSHRAAAALWGLDRLASRAIEITVSRDSRPRLQDVMVHRIADLAPHHVQRIGPLPVTSPARTLVDLGAVSRPWLVKRAVDQWLRERKVRGPAVIAMLDEVARKGRAGAGVLRKVLEERVLGLEPSDSDGEDELANLIRAYGVPEPEYHHLLVIGADVFELDFAYPDARLMVEVDGYGSHSSREAFEEDRRRRNLIEGEDWRILLYTPNRMRTRPWAVAAEIKRNLAARRGLPTSYYFVA